MAIYSTESIKKFGLFYHGRPFANVESSTTSDTSVISYQKFSYFDAGGFFRGVTGLSPIDTGNNVYAKVNGTWTVITEIYLNVNGTWRRSSNDKLYIKNSGIWKS